MKDLLKSSGVRRALWILGTVIAILIIFGLGAAVGYRRALFSSRYGENYYRNFYGGQPAGMLGPMGPAGQPSLGVHGVAGEVIDVASASIAVEDQSGNEQSVVVIPGTLIREDDDTIMMSAVQVGDTITVIGGPNGEGQIEARFIRVFPASSSVPLDQ